MSLSLIMKPFDVHVGAMLTIDRGMQEHLFVVNRAMRKCRALAARDDISQASDWRSNYVIGAKV